MPQPKQELDIPELEQLRHDLKEHGLERTVQMMSVAQRGLARRAFREGLSALMDLKKRAAEGVVQRPAVNNGDQSGYQP